MPTTPKNDYTLATGAARPTSLWKRKLTEGTATSVYWMVDHATTPLKQVRIKAEQVRFAYEMFKEHGNLDAVRDSWEHKEVLERLFTIKGDDRADRKGQLHALLTDKLWAAPSSTGAAQSPRPVTSFTNNNIDISGFQLLGEDGSDRMRMATTPANVNPTALYRITNRKTDRMIDVRARGGDGAVEAAMAKAGPNVFTFPLTVHNLDTDRLVHIMNDGEYDTKIKAVDQRSSLELQQDDIHPSKVRHPSEDDMSKWRQRSLSESTGTHYVHAAQYREADIEDARAAGIFVEEDGLAPAMTDGGPSITADGAPLPYAIWVYAEPGSDEALAIVAAGDDAGYDAYEIGGEDGEPMHGVVVVAVNRDWETHTLDADIIEYIDGILG